jgi:hypothetical protein
MARKTMSGGPSAAPAAAGGRWRYTSKIRHTLGCVTCRARWTSRLNIITERSSWPVVDRIALSATRSRSSRSSAS